MIGEAHWVIGVLHRKGKKVEVKIYDPWNEPYSKIQAVIGATKVPSEEEVENQRKRKDEKYRGCINISPLLDADCESEFKGSEALEWQTDAWSCGYFCLFALIKDKTLNKEAKMALLNDGGKFHLERMPNGR